MLALPIKEPWFSMIRNGEKKEEYREIKPYYTKRFQKIVAPRYLDKDNSWNHQWGKECRVGWYAKEPFEVLFRNGYSANSPSFIAKVYLLIDAGREEWGAEKGKQYYVLKILEVKETTKKETT